MRIRCAPILAGLVACGGGRTARPIAPPVEPTPTAAVEPAPPPGPIDDVVPGARGEGALIGTAGATRLLAAGPDGEWVALCQARTDDDHDGAIAVSFGLHGNLEGDRPHQYLVIGGGEGATIRGLEAISRDRRRLVIETEEGLWAIEPATGSAWELEEADDDRYRSSSAVAFSADGERVAYRSGTEVVVVDLAHGARTRTEVGDWVRGIDAVDLSGRWVGLLALRDGVDDLASSLSSYDESCWGRAPALVPGRALERRWVDVSLGQIVDRVAWGDGDRALSIDADGALALGAVALTDPGCDPWVDAITERPLRALYRCTDGELRVAGDGLAEHRVGYTWPRGDDRPPTPWLGEPLDDTCYGVDEVTTCVRLGDGALEIEPAHAVRSAPHRWLIADGDRLEFVDRSGEVTGPWLTLYDGRLVDLTARAVVAEAPAGEAAVAFSRAGALLIAPDAGDAYFRFGQGPLRWVR